MQINKKRAGRVRTISGWLVAGLLMVATFAAGCGPKIDPASKDPSKQGQDTGNKTGAKEYLFATGGTGGTYYPLGGAIANVWNQRINELHVTVQSTGASVENMKLLGNKETELAMAINSIAHDAYNGKGAFTKPIKNFRAVGVIYPEVIQIVTPKNSSIKSLEDLKGKRVSTGPAGSGTAVAAEQILEAYGIKLSELKVFQDTFTDAATKLKDGNLDAAFAILSVPAANIEDIATSKDVRILPVTGQGLETLKRNHPFYTDYVIPANTYKGQSEDVRTVSMQAVLYAREDLPEDIVYQITKTMYEQKDEIAKGYAIGKQISLEKALSGITVPLHSGAEKFYKEKGMK
ncbi:TAXI family TRAP transporter solute-binding subunit [Effusibacillus lacus]|uniref:C4-dicarboxylate ABC transporter substrate-binding protein n=1 Tax=Effusibacillus lacus TaxID=1348429 RepID=A0A292YQ60_9BACL|nr:TAXI family TRAP transporter solute-binding subunit [Effusibacillus lacus]TCS75722.1 hypothetical protein EDD64_10697 [Effusibacillus lacus]GAX91041.1 hypothetical protein EFBL_2701 [Effusibacillus lacus]